MNVTARRRILAFTSLFLGFLVLAQPARAVSVSGTISTNTTWSDTSQPYVIDNTDGVLTISAGATLTINSGVTIQSQNDNEGSFRVLGTLSATGATFELKTRDQVVQPIVVESNGTMTLDSCTLSVTQTTGTAVGTTALILAKGSASVQLNGSSLSMAPGLAVQYGVWATENATVAFAVDGATRGAVTGFPVGLQWDTSTDMSVSATDFSKGTHGIQLDNAAIDVAITDSSFANFSRGLNLPNAGAVTLTDISATQDEGAAGRFGVYTDQYTSFAISGAISNMYVGVHVSLGNVGVDVSNVIFSNCERDVLAEGAWAPGTISNDTTLTEGFYHVTNPITIAAGAKLTISPGVILTSNNYQTPMFYVDGILEATGARFDSDVETYDWMIHARNSGSVTVSECSFLGSMNAGFYTGYTSAFIGVTNTASALVQGCEFVTNSRRNGPMMHAVRTEEQGTATVTDFVGTRSTFSGFYQAIRHNSTKSMTLDGLTFDSCGVAILCDTIGNLFLYNTAFSACTTGLQLDDAGVVVSNNVIAESTPNAFSGTLAQVLSPQIGLAGFSFDEESYCRVGGNVSLLKDTTMPVLPLRIITTSGPLTIPEGVRVTFPAGCSITNVGSASNWQTFSVQGTLNATDCQFNLATSYSQSAIDIFGNGAVTLNECTLTGVDLQTYQSASRLLNVRESGSLTLAGCMLQTTASETNTPRAIWLQDTASVTVKDFNEISSGFAGFRVAIECTTVQNCPTVKPGTSFADCGQPCYLVIPSGGLTVDENTALACSELVINNSAGSITVAVGATLTIQPDSQIQVTDDGLLFLANGAIIANDSSFDLITYEWGGDRLFKFAGTGTGTFTDCILTATETSNENPSTTTAIFEAVDTAVLTLANCTVTGTRVGTAVRLLNDSRLLIPASGDTALSGFYRAISCTDLDSLGATPGLTFAGNQTDLFAEGGSTVTGSVTLPANSKMTVYCHLNPITIAPEGSVTFPAGCRVDNFRAGGSHYNMFLVQGAISASNTHFDLLGYGYDYSQIGTSVFTLTGSAQGNFVGCNFLSSDTSWDSNFPSKIFDVTGSANLTVRGGVFETNFGFDDHLTRSAFRVRESGTLTLTTHNDEGASIKGYPYAVEVLSALANVTVTDALLRENGTAVRMTSAPATWDFQRNTFIGNTTAAVSNEATEILDCRNNYWGHPSGPNHPSNPFGLGDPAIGNVLFIPYSAEGQVSLTAVRDHTAGQAANALIGTGNIDDAILLRFDVDSPEASTPVTGLVIRILEKIQVTAASFTNVRLVKDQELDGLLTTTSADTTAAVGTVDLAAGTITFAADIDLAGAWLVVADLVGIASGDAFSLRLSADDIIADADVFLTGATSTAPHFRDRLFLTDHRLGRFRNALLGAATQNDVVLTGFALTPGYQIQSLDATLSAIAGLAADNISRVELLVDSNGNGEEDFGERIVVADSISLSGTAGSFHFAFGAEPLQTGTDLVLRADLRGLRRDDTFAIQVLSANVTPVDSLVEVIGANTAVTHAVSRPMMILDPAFQADNGFVAASSLRQISLLGFTIFPGGRQINRISFTLENVQGIMGDEISNARIWLDVNGDGEIGTGETTTVGGAAVVVVDADSGTGNITFDGAFTVAGGDYLLIADFANLANDDALTISLESENVTPGLNDIIEGGITPIKHTVIRPELPTAAEQHNWTLTYRAPGGLTATGSYSPDGSKVIVGYSSGAAYVFDTAANRPLLMLHRHFDQVKYAGFRQLQGNEDLGTADQLLAITVTYDGAVYLWDVETGELEQNLFSDLLVRYAMPSPDADKLFIVTEGKALLLDLDTGRTLWEFVNGKSADDAQLFAADYSPDGSKILVGGADKLAYLLDAETGETIRVFSGHSQAVKGATFATDGTRVLTSSTDGTVTLWATDDNVNPVSTVTLSGEQAMGATVSRDGTQIAIVTVYSSTRRLRMFTDLGLELWNTVLPSKHFTDKFSSIRFNDQGDRVLLCSNAFNDWNYPAALAVQYAATDGSFIGFVGPRGRARGWDWDQLEQRTRVSEDGKRIFFMHSEGLDVMFTEFGKTILESSAITDQEHFDITPDGRKLVRVEGSVLKFFAVDETRLTLINENNIGADYGPLTLSRSGALTIHGDRLIRSLSGQIITNTPNADAGYRSAFSPDETLWGMAFYDDMSIKTMLATDDSGSLEYGVTHTDPYKPQKILYHPDGERIGCVDRYAGVQFYKLSDNEPTGLYDFRTGSGIPRIYDAALSHDGTMLAIARGNNVKLFDMRTGRVMRYFYPTHSGQATCYAISVGFGARDNMLSICWSDNYVEIFQRSVLTDLRLTPLTRTLPSGRSQTYQVRAVYDDGSSVDVTPSYVYRGGGVELAPGARLYADPPEDVTIEADKVTVNVGASGDIALTAVYNEGGVTRTAQATLTVGASPLTGLRADPDAITLSPGVVLPIRYTASFADGYEEDVTSQVSLAADPASRVRLAGNNVTVLMTAPPGDIVVTGSFEFDGIARTASTTITNHSPKSRWNRDWCTPGGDVSAMVFSPDGTQLAVGYSSGAVGLFRVGLTPTQYELEDVIAAHVRPVKHVHYRDDETLVTVGGDGLILQWDLTISGGGEPISRYLHDASLTAAAFYGDLMALGDNLGRVMLYSLVDNAIKWTASVHGDQVNDLAMDNDSILTAGADRFALLLDRATGDVTATYSAFAKQPVAVALQGGLMTVLSEDKRMARWAKGSQDDGLLEFFFPSTPTAMTFHNGNTYVATQANGSNAIWVYDANGLLLRWLSTPPDRGGIGALAVTPDGVHIITGRQTVIVEQETEEGSTIEVPSEFHSCQFWHLSRGSYGGSLAHNYSLNDARISADGSMLFTQSDRRVFRWSFQKRGAISGTKFLETGYFVPYSFAGLTMSGADSNYVATRVRSSIYIMQAVERLLHMSVHTDCDAFDISPDGTRLITNALDNNTGTRFWDINLDFPTVTAEHPTFSTDVTFLNNDDTLGAVADSNFISIFNTSGQQYAGIQIQDVANPPEDPPMGSEMEGPTVGEMAVSENGQRVAAVIRYQQKDALSGESKTTIYVQIYHVNEDKTSSRIYEILLGTVENANPAVAMAISGDGSLLFVGMGAAEAQGQLIQIDTGTVLGTFTPPSMGTDSNQGLAAAQFTENDNALMIAWREGYASLYRREGVSNLRLTPIARSVSPGGTVSFEASAVYADNSSMVVTERASFSVSPESAGTLNGNVFTVAGNVPADTVITVNATYTELGTESSGSATLKVQTATFLSLSMDPPKISLARGQSADLHVFAHFADNSVEEVTLDDNLEIVISDSSVLSVVTGVMRVSDNAQFGDVSITARLVREGDERSATTAVHIRQEGSMINPGDFDESLVVDFNDLLYFIGHYGEVSTNPTWDSRCDFSNDDHISFEDATTFIGLYGTDYHPTRDGEAPNLRVTGRNLTAAVDVWLEGPETPVKPGEVFHVKVWVRDNTLEAAGFRGGPVNIRFDSSLVTLDGTLDPTTLLQAPFNGLLTNGSLLAGQLAQFGGLTIANGQGDGQPVLYAVLPFRALAEGEAAFSVRSGSVGLALTPPIGQLTVSSANFTDDTVVIDLGEGTGESGDETSQQEVLYELVQGWNLIGLPLCLTSRSGWPDDLSFWTWSNDTYEQVSQLEPGKGYWAYSGMARSLVIKGFPSEPRALVLQKGWNLVAPHSPSAKPDSSLIGTCFGWDPAKQVYYLPEESSDGERGDLLPFKPWFGYWIYSPQPDVQIWNPVQENPRR
jgi:WD40 repeat protein